MGGGNSKPAASTNRPLGQTGAFAPALNTAATTVSRNWNEEFQQALDLIDKEDFARGYAQLASVTADFHDAAERMVEIIISELAVVEADKTYIESASLGFDDPNITVYEAKNITFTIAHGGQGSSSWLELGNELRHTTNVFRCKETALRLPLMCIFDFKGFRTLAQARLPAQNKQLLGYDTVIKGYILESPELNNAMTRIGKQLNLAKGKIGARGGAVYSCFHYSTSAWTPGSATDFTGGKKQRVYITNLRHLMPVDILRGSEGGNEAPGMHAEAAEKIRPEFLRRYAVPLTGNVNLPPPNAKPAAKYFHEDGDDALQALRKALKHLTRIVTMESIDSLSDKLRDEFPEPDDSLVAQAERAAHAATAAATASPHVGAVSMVEQFGRAKVKPGRAAEQELAMEQVEKMAVLTTQVQAEGLNLRMIGDVRAKINRFSKVRNHGDIRQLLLTEMVARILKVSVYKILREANGSRGKGGSIAAALSKGMTLPNEGMDEWDVEVPQLLDAAKIRNKKKPQPSNEACRSAIAAFFNIVFARQFDETNHDKVLQRELEEEGMHARKAEEVVTLANLIEDIRKKNKEMFPGALETMIHDLKKDLATTVRASVPGGSWMIDKYKQYKEHQAQSKEEEAAQDVRDQEFADKILRRKDPLDPFSIYWRVTMRDLIHRKYGQDAMSKDEQSRSWSVIDNIDAEVVLRRLAAITGIRFSTAAYTRAALVKHHPLSPLSVVKWIESDIEHLGPRVKDMGITLSSRGWQQIYKARSMAPCSAKSQLLTLAADTFADLFVSAPSDWVAAYDYGCALYELAWSSPANQRYEMLREAYRRFRHSHKLCREWLPSMLRLGDTVYAMTIMRQDSAVEEDYVNLCVDAADILDHAPDYAARCGKWADQLFRAASFSGGYRSQRLYTLSGVTYNEWIGLRGDDEAVSLAWIMQHHAVLPMEPADIGSIVDLSRLDRKGSKGSKDASRDTVFGEMSFKNKLVSDVCILLTSSRAKVGGLKHVNLTDLKNVTGESLTTVCEEHGMHLETLMTTTCGTIGIPDIYKALSLSYADGFGHLTSLHLDRVAHLRDEDLLQMANKIPQTLKTLSMQYNGQLEENGLVAMFARQTALTDINLTGCEHVADKALMVAAHCCHFLESVAISFCHHVTDAPLNQIAYRCRRHYTGRPGVHGKGIFCHDDPTLVLADLVIRNKGKKRKDEEDDDWNFDDEVGISDDPQAMEALAREKARKGRLAELKRLGQEADLTRAVKSSGVTMEQVREALVSNQRDSGGNENDEIEIDLDKIAVRMGLEDPAQREKRLRIEEKESEMAEKADKLREAAEMARVGARPFEISKRLNLPMEDATRVKEEWDLQHTKFEEVQLINTEDLHLYALQIKLPDCSVKKSLMSDVNPQSRIHIRIALTSGGTNKQSSLKPVMSDLQFNMDTFLPKIVDKQDILRVELCEKPDSGPSKPIAYYKAPMPKLIDYPVKLQTVPLFGSSGFFQDQPVGKMRFCYRVLGPQAFEDWKLSIENYDVSQTKKSSTSDGNKKNPFDKAGLVADRVMERVIEWTLTQLLDYFGVFKNFKKLEIAHCLMMSDYPIIELVRSMPSLNHLDLTGIIKISDTALNYIGKLCTKLSYLNITGCLGISDDGVAAVAAGCLHLEHIYLNECTNLSDASIAFIVNFDMIGRLKGIFYKGVYRTTEESLTQITGQCTSLTSLSVAGSAQYRDVQLLQMARNCQLLSSLDLGWCERISDQGIADLCAGCTRLTELNLSYCESVTSKGVIEIARNCPSIHTLDLTGLSRVEDDAVAEILKSMLNLSWLSLSLCELLSKNTLSVVMDWGEGLTTLEILGCSSISRKDVIRFKQRLHGRTHVVDESDDADILL